MELQKAVLLVAISLSGWSVLALLVDRRGHPGIHRAFALLLASMCVTLGYFYSRLVVPGGVPLLGAGAQAALWLKGPLLWWMVRLAAGRPPARPGLHLVPFVVVLATLLARPSTGLVVQVLGCLHALGYLAVSGRGLASARPRLVRIWRGHPNTAYYWLLWLLAGVVAMVAADLALIVPGLFRGQVPIAALERVAWPISAWLLVVAWALLYRPPRFRGGAATTNAGPGDEAAGMVPDDAGPTTTGPANWRELDEGLACALAGHLDRLMDEQQLYRDGDLSLPRLAGQLGISTHQTSELLNVHLGIGFYEYLARQRLAHACRLLRDPDCEWRVIDIAFESGFGNKNSFYRQFREALDMTPVQYRQRHQAGATTA